MSNELSINDKRLIKRQYLVENFESFFAEAIYYRTHKDNFRNTRLMLWALGSEEESSIKYDPS